MSKNSGLWYFENVNLFRLLCPAKTGKMKENHQVISFKKGENIDFPEVPTEKMYLIDEGRVRIGTFSEDHVETEKAQLSQGELFGELPFKGEEKNLDFAQAMDDGTKICLMDFEEMKRLMPEKRDLSFKIIKLVGLKLKKLERQVEQLIFKDARTRIVELLHEEEIWKSKKMGQETLLSTRLTHKEIANLTGTSRPTVTDTLNALKEKDIITFDRKKILIRDLEMLK